VEEYGNTDGAAAASATETEAFAGFSSRERVILLILASVQFTSIVDFMVVMPLGPQLERTLHLSPAQFGMIISSYTFAAGIAGLIASVVVDRFARRPAFLTLYVGFLAGTLLCGMAPNYATLLAARFVTGAFGGILGGMAMAIIGDVFHEERRGRATGALMSAFALASVFGVPIGLTLGLRYGWHAPFLVLAALGLPVLFISARALPRLDSHLTKVAREHPLEQLRATFTDANHLRAFALSVSLMLGSFAVLPFLSPFLVANVGVAEKHLPIAYILGGALTLVGAPLAGRMADRYGKLRVYRVIAPMTAVVMLIMTNLPPVPLWVAVVTMALLMLSNAGRMVPAMAMITSSVLSHRRGGFLGANAAVQHIAAGLGTSIGGQVLSKAADGRMLNYPLAGLIGAGVTLASLWLAGRLRSAEAVQASRMDVTLAGASADGGEPLPVIEPR
jgi:MFS transporter, DHA1 family, inner membrane transport protein